MTDYFSLSKLPWFAIVYGAAGVSTITYGVLRAPRSLERLVASLGAVAISIGLLNLFVEKGGRPGESLPGFGKLAVLLIVVISLALRALSVRLMEMTVSDRKLAERFTMLPFVYFFLIGVAVSTKDIASFERPALGLYMLVALACLLHVCAFAFGRAEAVRRLVGTGKLQPVFANQNVWRYAIPALIVPTLLALAAQFIVGDDDWRLIATDIVVTAALLGLILAACSQPSQVMGPPLGNRGQTGRFPIF
jgi:hypothetical protein